MPQWRQGLTKSLHQTRSMPESRYFQLATVDGSGVPYCRTVVFRGITDDNQLVVISDTRSDKYDQLGQNPHSQVCWYLLSTGINCQMQAKSSFCGASPARQETMVRHYRLKGILV